MIDLPEELKSVSKPKFKIVDDAIIIYNKPFWDDWIFEIVMSIAIIAFIVNNQIEYRNDYLFLFIAFLVIRFIILFSK